MRKTAMRPRASAVRVTMMIGSVAPPDELLGGWPPTFDAARLSRGTDVVA
jgi:hypothetical protein